MADAVILTVNAGSSSLRLAAFALRDGAPEPLATEHDATPPASFDARIGNFLARCGAAAPSLVAHRVVHGGPDLCATAAIDADVERRIDAAAALAPLHNPAALAGIRACRRLLPSARAYAVFDTAFFAGLPAAARHYALPRALVDRHRLRRYGFHGIAHEALWRRWRTLRPDVPDGGRVVTFQLGAGASAAAIERGRPLDTSMGYTPLEGLVMGTRSGDVDAGLVCHLQRAEGLSPSATEQLLSHESGLLGMAGAAGMRELLARDDDAAQLAVELYCQRARKYLGAYLAVLGGADAVLFGGGVGEHAPRVRERILGGMEWAGIAVDRAANDATLQGDARISADGSRVDVRVLRVDEAALMAHSVLAARAATARGGD